jgi:hypothetical protein
MQLLPSQSGRTAVRFVPDRGLQNPCLCSLLGCWLVAPLRLLQDRREENRSLLCAARIAHRPRPFARPQHGKRNIRVERTETGALSGRTSHPMHARSAHACGTSALGYNGLLRADPGPISRICANSPFE